MLIGLQVVYITELEIVHADEDEALGHDMMPPGPYRK